MPLFKLKNYFINSEDEIPKEYMEIIEQKLNAETATHISEEIIPGKRGKVTPKGEMAELLSDSQKLYFGHGTPVEEDRISTILEEGLKVKNPEAVSAYDSHLSGLVSTTIEYGIGESDLFEDIKEELDNWPHKDSKNVIIVSVPLEYALPFRIALGGRNADLYETFYTGNEEEGMRLRPEFIMGIYNANTQSFTHNENFYQNLPENQQLKLLEEMKKRYIMSYAEHATLSPEEARDLIPLKEDKDLEALSIEWYKVQLKKLREDRCMNTKPAGDVQETALGVNEQFDDSLWIDIDEMAEGTKISDFEGATHLIKDEVQHKKNGEKEGGGWSVDEEW